MNRLLRSGGWTGLPWIPIRVLPHLHVPATFMTQNAVCYSLAFSSRHFIRCSSSSHTGLDYIPPHHHTTYRAAGGCLPPPPPPPPTTRRRRYPTYEHVYCGPRCLRDMATLVWTAPSLRCAGCLHATPRTVWFFWTVVRQWTGFFGSGRQNPHAKGRKLPHALPVTRPSTWAGTGGRTVAPTTHPDGSG